MAVVIDVVVPSMSRAERVLTKDAVANIILCVPESQLADYQLYNPGVKIETHPDSIKGIALKRQWIIEHHMNVFMIDDDITHIGNVYSEKGEKSKYDKDEAYDIIQYVGNCAKLAGAYLFGLSTQPNPLTYLEMSPIKLTGNLHGDIGVLEGSKLYFHAKSGCADDYWISAYNAYLYRYMWQDTRFHAYGKDTFSNTGGCANVRTTESEKENTLFLRKMFGEAITLKGDTKLAKRKLESQRTLKIPF